MQTMIGGQRPKWIAGKPSFAGPWAFRSWAIFICAQHPITLGAIQMPAKFNYPTEFVTLPDYSAHRGQTVKVIRKLRDDECDPECQPMYLIQAEDGWQGNASLDELELLPDISI